VRLLPGQQVRKGQVLLILEDPEFIHLQEEYLTAKNRLDLAMLDLKRQESLAQDTVNARKALERAQSEAALLRVSVHSTQEQLALIGINAASLTAENISRNVSVKAPFDGFITQVSVNTGSAVPPRGQLVEMADPSRLHVALQVFERDAAFVRQGQTTQVEVSGQSVPRNARIHLVGTEVGLDRSVVVHAHFDKPDASLRPGTTVTATINIEPRQALLVPESAIVTQAGKSSVYVRMPDGSLRNTDVTTGARTDGLIEVASPDLHPESEVLVKGAMVR
jgi:cobalt-zinc-cadmium efflux system membrane fusion protein